MTESLGIWIALFSTGLVGSLHCIGMCGPIALSLPVTNGNFYAGRGLYQVGRVSSYAIIGVLFGTFGSVVSFAGFQQRLSILAGVLLLIFALYRLLKLNKYLPQKGFIQKYVVNNLSRALGRKSQSNLFLIGFLNGFLPCGLVYAAAAMTVAFGNPWMGGAGMVLFGLGTVPVMFTMSIGRKIFAKRPGFRFQFYSSLIVLVIGVLFVLRGMNLGIKYISPKIDVEQESVECCHPAE